MVLPCSSSFSRKSLTAPATNNGMKDGAANPHIVGMMSTGCVRRAADTRKA